MRRWPLIALLLACLSGATTRSEEPKPADSSNAIRERVAALILQLDDESFEKREEATKELVTIGKAALHPVQAALQDERQSAEAQGRLRKIAVSLHHKLLSITIKSNTSECLLTDIVKLTCTMRNDSDEPMTVLPPLEGSLTRNRQPYYSFEVTRNEDGRTVEASKVKEPEKKNYISAFKTEDFIKLEPGKEITFDPHFMRWCYQMHEIPGKYKIRLNYALKRTFEVVGEIKPHADAVNKLMNEAWEGESTSNEIEVTVKPEQKK